MPSVLPPLSTETPAPPQLPAAAPQPAPDDGAPTLATATREPSGPAAEPRSASASVVRPTQETPTALPFQTGSAHAAGFEPAPLPAEWIHSGRPEPRSKALTRAADGRLSSGLWECPAGSFTYIFPCDEIVHILEGDVIVESHGQRRHLKPGDVAYFPQDLHTVWTVRHYVKKLAIFRVVPRPLLKRIASRLFRR